MAEQQAADGYEAFSAPSGGAEPVNEGVAYDAFSEPSGSSASDKVRAAGNQATGAMLETGGAVGGMAMGAAIGTLGGPAALVTVPLGAAIGGLSGFIAGRRAREIAGIPEIKDLPPDQRPYGFAGEVIGGSVPFAAAPLAAARMGARLPATRVGDFLNRIIDFAEESPRLFAAGEAAMASGAAVAGAVAEAYRPGETGVRIGAEIAGGFFNPTRLVTAAGKAGLDAGTLAIQSLSAAGRETRAAKILQEIVQEAGEDPAILAQLLRDSGIPGVAQTSAQKTGSPALIALEQKLGHESARFGAEAGKTAEDSLSAIKNMIVALKGTGDPAALNAAADLRSRYFRTLLAGRVQTAEREAVEAAQRITLDSPRARAQLSARANEALTNALDEARAAERQLWEAVPRDVPANAGGLLNRYDEIRAGILPEEPLPSVVEGFVGRMRETQGVTNSGELLRFRSRALALAREADAQGKPSDARIYGELAEAALDDLSAIGARGGGALDEARAFSRELHETFTRTFAGEAMDTTLRGRDRIPPELLLRRALGSGEEGAQLRFQELEQATRFLSGRAAEATSENVDIMLDAQQRLLRLAASEAIDPNTGRASATRLGRFLRDNEALLDRFPEVRTDIQGAIRSEQGLADIERMATGANRIIESQSAFGKLAKVENPVDAIRSAISGRNPVADLGAYAKLAKRGGQQAVDGMKAAIFDHAIRKSTDEAGDMSFQAMRANLFNPVRPGQPSLVQIMQREGMVTGREVRQIARLLDEAEKIEKAVAGSDPALAKIAQESGGIFDTVARSMGSKAAKALGGDTLIAQGAGARFMNRIMMRYPQLKFNDVLIEAMRNPRLAAALLEKPGTGARRLTVGRQIHAYLLQAGLVNDERPEESPAETDAPTADGAPLDTE